MPFAFDTQIERLLIFKTHNLLTVTSLTLFRKPNKHNLFATNGLWDDCCMSIGFQKVTFSKKHKSQDHWFSKTNNLLACCFVYCFSKIQLVCSRATIQKHIVFTKHDLLTVTFSQSTWIVRLLILNFFPTKHHVRFRDCHFSKTPWSLGSVLFVTGTLSKNTNNNHLLFENKTQFLSIAFSKPFVTCSQAQ